MTHSIAEVRKICFIAILCCLALGSIATAADQGITGKKLLLKSKPKMVLLSKDALVVPGAAGSSSDPRCVADGGGGLGGSVTLSDGINSVVLDMPCENWSANGAGTLYRYKDKSGTPKVAKIRAGLLRVFSRGMGGFPVPDGADSVIVEVAVGVDKYCMIFTGTGDGNKFFVKDAAAATCSPAQTCGNGIAEGTEACDGNDAAACPNDCLGDCTCAPLCPATGGNATACAALFSRPACQTCCQADGNCGNACVVAYQGYLCSSGSHNDACSNAANAAGCAAECCL